jgi:hypothetical protein
MKSEHLQHYLTVLKLKIALVCFSRDSVGCSAKAWHLLFSTNEVNLTAGDLPG